MAGWNRTKDICWSYMFDDCFGTTNLWEESFDLWLSTIHIIAAFSFPFLFQ